MTATEIRLELEALLKEVRLGRVNLVDAQLRVDILAELVRLKELEARTRQYTQGKMGKD